MGLLSSLRTVKAHLSCYIDKIRKSEYERSGIILNSIWRKVFAEGFNGIIIYNIKIWLRFYNLIIVGWSGLIPYIYKRFSICTLCGFSANKQRNFIELLEKTNAICIGQVDLFQPVMMYFYPSGNNRKFNEYWVSRCFKAHLWLNFFKIGWLLFFAFLKYFIFWFFSDNKFHLEYNHIKPRMNISGK